MNDFKVGQKVEYHKDWQGRVVTKIIGITKTEIITEDGETFNLQGKKMYSPIIEKYSLEICNDI